MELTDQQGWSRVHGAIVGAVDHSDVLIHLLEEHKILAEVQQFTNSGSQISMVLAERHGRVGCLNWESGDPELYEGILIEDLVEELAQALDAEVRIGSFVADCLPTDSHSAAPEKTDNTPREESTTSTTETENEAAPRTAPTQEDLFPASVRMVEISSTPASSAPLFAAIHGAPLGSVELEGNQRALYAHIDAGRKGWGFGELPTVTLVCDHDGVTVLLVTDDHVEHMSSYDWSMNRTLVAGERANVSASELPSNLADLVTKRLDLLRIAEAVEGANPHMFALAALGASEPEDWQVAVAALGLPQSAIDFLSGAGELDELHGVELHPPISVSSAIGRSVDLALDEVSTSHPLWDTYETFVHDRPWLLNGAIAAEAIAGAGLLAYSIVSRSPRNGWQKAAGVAGVALIVDSIAEFGVKSYVKHRGL